MTQMKSSHPPPWKMTRRKEETPQEDCPAPQQDHLTKQMITVMMSTMTWQRVESPWNQNQWSFFPKDPSSQILCTIPTRVPQRILCCHPVNALDPWPLSITCASNSGETGPVIQPLCAGTIAKPAASHMVYHLLQLVRPAIFAPKLITNGWMLCLPMS
jgi:hypothetical protein